MYTSKKYRRVFNGRGSCKPIVIGVAGECTYEIDIRIGNKNTEVTKDSVANIESIYWSDSGN